MIQTGRSGTEYGGRGAAREVGLADLAGLTACAGGEAGSDAPGPCCYWCLKSTGCRWSANVSASRHPPSKCVTVLLFVKVFWRIRRARGLMGRGRDRVLQDPVSVGNPEIPAGIERDGIGGIQSFLADLAKLVVCVKFGSPMTRLAASWVENGAVYSRISLVEQVRNPEIPAGVEREGRRDYPCRRRRRHGAACEVRLADYQARGLTGGKGSLNSNICCCWCPNQRFPLSRPRLEELSAGRCGREGVRWKLKADHRLRAS